MPFPIRPLALALLLAAAGCHATSPPPAGLYAGLDGYHRPIATDVPDAQRWFDQGLVLTYGFNHAEAIRSFERAAELDPSSPMPWWGIAYGYGININDPVMNDERWRLASEAAEEGLRRLDGAPAREAGLMRALAARYSWPPPAEQTERDQAYADAMGALWAAFPNDPDIGALYAESLMNLQPWDYWTADGAPKGNIETVVATLEAVIALDPKHPAANHLLIHALEAGPDPDRAVAAAELLEDRVPGSGHLVHMPSHIYVRVGRYTDAAEANVRAIAADRAYFTNAPKPEMYRIYYAHNQHFLAYAAMMEGRYEVALQAARDLEREMPDEDLMALAPLIEGIMPTTFHVLIRFGKWDEILAEPERAEYRLVSRAVRHYARSIAYSALDQPALARQEIAAFESAAAAIPEDWFVFNNAINTVLPIARHMLEGELAFREGRYDDAFAALRRGAEAEDNLVYDEPPAWMLPMRHPLGAFLMSTGRHAEAEAVYREDLVRNRDNGWGLLGLTQALEAQERFEEAAALAPALAVAWANADLRPTASCMCEPREQWAQSP